MDRRCPMCPYQVRSMDELFYDAKAVLDALFERHIDAHVEDFRIEMLMTLDA